MTNRLEQAVEEYWKKSLEMMRKGGDGFFPMDSPVEDIRVSYSSEGIFAKVWKECREGDFAKLGDWFYCVLAIEVGEHIICSMGDDGCVKSAYSRSFDKVYELFYRSVIEALKQKFYDYQHEKETKK